MGVYYYLKNGAKALIFYRFIN